MFLFFPVFSFIFFSCLFVSLLCSWTLFFLRLPLCKTGKTNKLVCSWKLTRISWLCHLLFCFCCCSCHSRSQSQRDSCNALEGNVALLSFHLGPTLVKWQPARAHWSRCSDSDFSSLPSSSGLPTPNLDCRLALPQLSPYPQFPPLPKITSSSGGLLVHSKVKAATASCNSCQIYLLLFLLARLYSCTMP